MDSGVSAAAVSDRVEDVEPVVCPPVAEEPVVCRTAVSNPRGSACRPGVTRLAVDPQQPIPVVGVVVAVDEVNVPVSSSAHVPFETVAVSGDVEGDRRSHPSRLGAFTCPQVGVARIWIGDQYLTGCQPDEFRRVPSGSCDVRFGYGLDRVERVVGGVVEGVDRALRPEFLTYC